MNGSKRGDGGYNGEGNSGYKYYGGTALNSRNPAHLFAVV